MSQKTFPIDAIIFDFDGVLVESIAIKGEAFAALYEDHSPEIQQAVKDHHQTHGGMSRYDKIRYYEESYAEPPTEKRVEEMAQRFSDIVEQQVIACPWVKGAEDFLKAYHERLLLYVASATPTEELKRIIAGRKMMHYFKDIFGSPASKGENIAAILNQYNHAPERTLMIGDAMSDYKGAQENNVPFIGRISEGKEGNFPEGTVLINDLTALADHLDI